MPENKQYDLFDLLSLLSLTIGIQNLQENRQQSRHNDVQAANNRQAEYLMKEINRKFDEQNKILAEQNKALKKLLSLLGGYPE